MTAPKIIGTIIGLAVLAGVLVTPATTVAQDNTVRNQNIPVLELDQADIRDALKIIFKAVNANYTVSSEVQGTVTVHLRDVPFETALRNVLNQVNATYRVEASAYVIIPKPETIVNPGTTDTGATAPTTTSKSVVKIKIRNADPALIALILAGNAEITNPPESSTMTGLGGGGQSGGGGFSSGGGGFSSGGGGFSSGGGGFSSGGGGFSSGGGGFSGGGFGGGGGGFGGGGGGFGGGR